MCTSEDSWKNQLTEEEADDYQRLKATNVKHTTYSATTRSAKRKMELGEIRSTLQRMLTLMQKSMDNRSDIERGHEDKRKEWEARAKQDNDDIIGCLTQRRRQRKW